MSSLNRRDKAFCSLFFFAGLLFSDSASADVSFDPKSSQMRFAADEINVNLALRRESAFITLEIDPSLELKTEGFSIVKTSDGCRVAEKDPAGAMYGGLDLAETIRSEGYAAARSKQQNPYMQMRGIKFSIPLDARTPSYSDVSDAAQKNILEMWSMGFWKEYLDTLAKHRYNYVSLWSMHPFPSLVKVAAFPDVALADIKRSKGPFKEYYSMRGIWDEPELGSGNLETLRLMTIDEKIAFWREVMASLVYPRVTGFHWGSLDFMWYIEGMRSEDKYAKKKVRKPIRVFMTLRPSSTYHRTNMLACSPFRILSRARNPMGSAHWHSPI